MKKIKTWIKPTRNKIILLTLLTLTIGILIFSIPLLREDIPVVVFKENIIFEYGDSTSTSTFDMKSYNDVLSGKAESDAQIINSIYIPNFVDLKKSDFDTLSFDFSTDNNEGRNQIDTSFVGTNLKFTMNASKGNTTIPFEFYYSVEDTQFPKFNSVVNIDTPYGNQVDYPLIIRATDPVDGDLEVSVLENVNYTKPGIYPAIAYATDSNNNTSKHDFTVTVAEESEDHN